MYRSRKTNRKYGPSKTKKRLIANPDPAICPLCNMESDQLIYTGKTMVVTKNIFPYQYWEFMDVVDHLMIVPKRHVLSIAEFSDQEKLEAMELFADYEERGYNLYARSVENNMKSIPHQHTHLIKTEGSTARAGIFSKKPYFVWKV